MSNPTPNVELLARAIVWGIRLMVLASAVIALIAFVSYGCQGQPPE